MCKDGQWIQWQLQARLALQLPDLLRDPLRELDANTPFAKFASFDPELLPNRRRSRIVHIAASERLRRHLLPHTSL